MLDIEQTGGSPRVRVAGWQKEQYPGGEGKKGGRGVSGRGARRTGINPGMKQSQRLGTEGFRTCLGTWCGEGQLNERGRGG